MTQADNVLALLQARGQQGIHTFELRGEHYIGNPSQRIAELERRGYVVSSVRERLNGRAIGARYRLVSSPSGALEEVQDRPASSDGGIPAPPRAPEPKADWRKVIAATKGAPTFVQKKSPYKPVPELDELWDRAYGDRRRGKAA